MFLPSLSGGRDTVFTLRQAQGERVMYTKPRETTVRAEPFDYTQDRLVEARTAAFAATYYGLTPATSAISCSASRWLVCTNRVVIPESSHAR